MGDFISGLNLNDLPAEILIMVFDNLDNSEVLYSFMGINQRFDTIVNDSMFTRNLTLTTPFNGLNQLTDPILDRFCLQILLQIHHKIEWINVESSWIEPILLPINYPNLHGIGLYNLLSFTGKIFSLKKIRIFFYLDGSFLFRHLKNQIDSLAIEIKEGGPTDSFEI